jgi:YggT family protein
MSSSALAILKLIYDFIWWAAVALGAAGALLIILRSLFLYVDVNPFTWHARNVRRATDPVVAPVRRMLIAFRLDPAIAPLIVIVMLIVVLVLMIQFAGTVLNTIAGILYVVANRKPGAPMAMAGYVLFGLLGLYTLMIFVRVIYSWLGVSYRNRFARFSIQVTEPLLAPLRRWVPMAGAFDISPIIAFVILWIAQSIVASTLLRGWPVQFF